MEAIIFCGIQATGKTTFYRDYFLKTHIRISLDMLHTRNKENIFLQTCFETQQRLVLDNTNLTKGERMKYITNAKAAKFRVIGYYFQSEIEAALKRNENRKGKECIPEKGIRGSLKKLEVLTYEEGFDQIYLVQIMENNFVITEVQNKSVELKGDSNSEIE